MPASTTLITNITTVYTNGPQGNTPASAIAPAGPIMDYPGMTIGVKRALQEANRRITELLQNTDQSGDAANYTLLSNVLLSLS